MNVRFRPGDCIGQKYTVLKVLGQGGFGTVYLVQAPNSLPLALKSIRDELFPNGRVRQKFFEEANLWIKLDQHPHITKAHFVDKVDGRLYVGLELVAPDWEGSLSLQDHLTRQPPTTSKALKWAIECCRGMEFAYSKGLRCHRDIKPSNILIHDGRIAKITDFGLAIACGTFHHGMSPTSIDGAIGVESAYAIGTPAYMAPEQFIDVAKCDERSDIYSFGIVLYQLAAGGQLPFPNKDTKEELRIIYERHVTASIPELNHPTFPIIKRCVQKEPARRYATFAELRNDLEVILKKTTGEAVPQEPTQRELDAWQWNDKGVSLKVLGKVLEAIPCYDKSMELDPMFAPAWTNKGIALTILGRIKEALVCFEEALWLLPDNPWILINKAIILRLKRDFTGALTACDSAIQFAPRSAVAWGNRARILSEYGRAEEALQDVEKAITQTPHNSTLWCLKGMFVKSLGRVTEAMDCFQRAITENPFDVDAWNNIGVACAEGKRLEEANQNFSKALEIDISNCDTWLNKGRVLKSMGHLNEAAKCFRRAHEINGSDEGVLVNLGLIAIETENHNEAIMCFHRATEINPQNVEAWFNLAGCLQKSGQHENAIFCYDKVIALNPELADAWSWKGNQLSVLSRFDEARDCLKQAVALDPGNFLAWYSKALSEEHCGSRVAALHSYERFIVLAPLQMSQQIEFAKRKISVLKTSA